MAISCDPRELANAARCFCSDPKGQAAIQTYLLCQIANLGLSSLFQQSSTPVDGGTVTVAVPTGPTLFAAWTAGQDETVTISGTPTVGQRLFLCITGGVFTRLITLDSNKFRHNSSVTGSLVFAVKGARVVVCQFVWDGTRFHEVDGREMRGTVKKFSGLTGNIPDDYVFCDGTPNAMGGGVTPPDMRNRMLVCAQTDSGGIPKLFINGIFYGPNGGAVQHNHGSSGMTAAVTGGLAGGDVLIDSTPAGNFDTTLSAAGGVLGNTDNTPNDPTAWIPWYTLGFMIKL